MRSLRIDVSTLLHNPGQRIHWAYSNPFEVEEIGFNDPVLVEAVLTGVGRRVLLHGRLQATVPCLCSRCLEPYSHEILETIDEEFIPADMLPEGGKDLAFEELSIFPYTEETIELGEVVRQYLILGRPLQPLCRERCAGLCARCGKNLNEGPCGCKSDTEDPRWAALKSLAQP